MKKKLKLLLTGLLINAWAFAQTGVLTVEEAVKLAIEKTLM